MNNDCLYGYYEPKTTLRNIVCNHQFMIKSNQESLKKHLYVFFKRGRMIRCIKLLS